MKRAHSQTRDKLVLLPLCTCSPLRKVLLICQAACRAVLTDLAARRGVQRTEVHQFLRRPSLPPLESNTRAHEDGTTLITVVYRPPRQVPAHALTELGVAWRLCKAEGSLFPYSCAFLMSTRDWCAVWCPRGEV